MSEVREMTEWVDQGYAAYNPNDLPIDQLPTIYGFNSGGERGWMLGELISEDGTGLGSHVCSSEGYMYTDLGVKVGHRPDRHKVFREHHPNGYKMDFVPGGKVENHEGLQAALRLNQDKRDNQ